MASNVTRNPSFLTRPLEVRGPAGTGADSAGVLTLSTSETTIVGASNDQLGRIDFQAPIEESGTDAVLVGASIYAIAQDDFDDDENKTELVFATSSTSAPVERFRITSAGFIGIGVTHMASSQPSAPFHTATAGSATHIKMTQGGYDVGELGISQAGPVINSSSTMTDQTIYINSAQRDTDTIIGMSGAVAMTVLGSNGFVGIGVPIPSATLEVLDTTTQLKLSYDADSFSTITVADNSHTTIATGESGDFTLDAAGDVDLDAGGGNIGFKSGGSTLGSFDTNGNFVVKGTITSDGDATIGTAGNTTALTLKVIENTGDRAGKNLTISAGGAVASDKDNNGGDLILSSGHGDGTGTSAMKFLTKILNVDLAQERMRIHTNGNVGIGVADPTAPLEVLAEIGFPQMKVSYNDDSFINITVANDSHTTIATGESGDITLDSGNDIVIDTGRDCNLNTSRHCTVDAGYDIILDADGDQVTMKFGGATGQIDFSNENSGDGVIQQKIDAKDLVIKQYDGDEIVRFTDGGDVKVTNTVYFAAETANTIGNGATGTIDWNVSQKQKVTITGTGITCNFTNPAGACNLLLKVVQGDGSDVIATWDSDIKWPSNDTVPTLSTGNGDIDIISFYFDGTNYFGVASLDFA